MNVCLDTYYICWSIRGALGWRSDKSVLLEVNSQEDGSVCCVFIGTMIHINNLACLPGSPFILFSSLPFDIPACFHSQKLCALCPEGERKIYKEPEETSPSFQKVGK